MLFGEISRGEKKKTHTDWESSCTCVAMWALGKFRRSKSSTTRNVNGGRENTTQKLRLLFSCSRSSSISRRAVKRCCTRKRVLSSLSGIVLFVGRSGRTNPWLSEKKKKKKKKEGCHGLQLVFYC